MPWRMRTPMLRGTIRDQVTRLRRPLLRFFVCEEDISHDSPDAVLPQEVASGKEAFYVIGAIVGGSGSEEGNKHGCAASSQRRRLLFRIRQQPIAPVRSLLWLDGSPGKVAGMQSGSRQRQDVRNPYFLQVANQHRITLYAA